MDQDVIAIFHELANRSLADREDYYAERRVPPAVRQEVESLLRFDGQSESALTGFMAAAVENAWLDSDSILTGSRYGSYRLVRLLGRGGMGSVYEAEQDSPRRIVAFKVITPGMASADLMHRFEQESQALGRLQHPGIAQIYEAGTADTGFGRQPFFAMELVRGDALLQYADAQHLDTRQRLELVARICDGVDHAHQRGIIHRDLKPSNILVDAAGQPKILDFGVARVTDSDVHATRHTDVGQLIGTLAYMSPEQVLADPLEVDTRSDVYALGVILYELLSGRLPYNTAGKLHEAVQAIREEDAAPLGTVNRVYRGDVETIVAKALEKEKSRRYGSVAALAADIRRYLHDEPIVARPPGTVYHLQKFAKRHKALVAGVSAVFVALVAGVIVSTWQAGRARRAERAADQQARAAGEQRDFALRQLSRAETINDLNGFLLSDAAPSGKPFTARDLLARAERIVEHQAADARGNRIDLLISIGMQYQHLDEGANARRLLAEADDLARRQPDRALQATAACALADAIVDSEPQRAERLLDEALAGLPSEPQFILNRVDCLLKGSLVARERGDEQLGIERVQAAQRLLTGAPMASPVLDLRVAMELAESYRMAGRDREANVAFEAAAKRMADLGRGDTEWATTLLNNWGLTLYGLGRPLEAERLFRRAVQIESADGTDAGVSPMLMLNLARSLNELNRLAEARHFAEAAYEKARQAGDEAVISQSMMARAVQYRRMNDLARAARVLTELDARWHRMLPEGSTAFANLAMEQARLAQASGDSRAALSLADRAVDLMSKAQENADYLSLLLVRRSEIRLQARLFEEARVDATRSLAVLKSLVEPGASSSVVGRAYYLLGRALIGRGRIPEAREALRSAHQHFLATLGADHEDTRRALELAEFVAGDR